MRRISVARKRELQEFNRTLVIPQPNRGSHRCTGCGETFQSEAAFAYHRRPRANKRVWSADCLAARLLRKAGFTGGVGRKAWRAPARVEVWYLDQLKVEFDEGRGFRREEW